MSWENIINKAKIGKVYTRLLEEIMDNATTPLTSSQIIDELHNAHDRYKKEFIKKYPGKRSPGGRNFPTRGAVISWLKVNAVKTDQTFFSQTYRGNHSKHILYVGKKHKRRKEE